MQFISGLVESPSMPKDVILFFAISLRRGGMVLI
jgi:hypothetical protein